MNRNRLAPWLAVVLACGALMLAGCSRDKNEDSAPGKAGAAPAEAAGQGSGAAGSLNLAVFPSDTDVLMSLSMERLRASAMWNQWGKKVEEGAAEELAELKACGLDPLSQMTSISMGGNTSSDDRFVILISGFPRAALKDCAEAVGEKKGTEVSIEDEGNLTHYAEGDEDFWVAWLDDTTLIIAPERDKEWLAARAAGKDGLSADSELARMTGKVDQSATLWFAGIAGEEGALAENFKALGTAKPTAAYGSMTLDEGIAFQVAVGFASAADATQSKGMVRQMTEMASAQLPALAPLVSKLSITTSGSELVLSLALSAEEVATLSELLRAMFGGIPGGK